MLKEVVMTTKFIYVTNDKDKERLSNQGFKLLKEDAVHSLYIFYMNENIKFDFSNIKYTMTDVLTF